MKPTVKVPDDLPVTIECSFRQVMILRGLLAMFMAPYGSDANRKAVELLISPTRKAPTHDAMELFDKIDAALEQSIPGG